MPKTAKVRVLQSALYWAGEVVFRPLMTSDSFRFDQFTADCLESKLSAFPNEELRQGGFVAIREIISWQDLEEHRALMMGTLRRVADRHPDIYGVLLVTQEA
jgi:hypothetical protein